MKAILKQFTQREAHPFVQFIKYSMCGATATVVDVIIFYSLSAFVIYALQPDDGFFKAMAFLGLDLHVSELPSAVQERNFIINSSIAFIFSNFTAYILNVLWVFESGKHSRHKELVLFYAVSFASIILGIFLGWLMIHYLHMSTTASFIGKMISALLINYSGRKYLIFKG